MTDSQLVSVVIPAYNAATTLDETLRSARSQTHRMLEIIVVNDGSIDDTLGIAKQHAAVDSRVRVFTQDNAGVAAARNTGWRSAQSDLIAFLDADDLWAPTKIERQIQALKAGGAQIGLVYCWSVRIDSTSTITRVREGAQVAGDVLEQIMAGNFVGNGSSALVRRNALIDAHGFESGLRAARAEGCEDWLLLCRVAEGYHFAVVPEHLVGYRNLPENMSSNRPRMLQSWMLAHDELLARQPEYGDALKRGVHNYGNWLVRDALAANRLKDLPLLLLLLYRRYPSVALSVLLKQTPSALSAKVRVGLRKRHPRKAKSKNAEIGRRFLIGNPDSCC